MIYRVIVQPGALDDLDRAYQGAAAQAPTTAKRWLARFEATFETLRQNPERCEVAPESRFVNYEVR